MINKLNNSDTVLFKSSEKDIEFSVIIDEKEDTVWANQEQIIELFGKSRRTIGEHIKNIYTEEELEKHSTWREIRQVQIEGKRKVNRKVSYYNLDVIISIGYRVKSKRGIEFRKWATKKLKEYLIQGYSINSKLLLEQNHKIQHLEKEINDLNFTLFKNQEILTDGLLNIISNYSKTFELLNKFDSDDLDTNNLNQEISHIISYPEVTKAIKRLKENLIEKNEASELFGREKDKSFEGILGSISQTVFGELAYPTIEEQASQLLYSIIKGHSFSDGNKRIGSFIFVWFLEQNNYHLDKKGERKITENTLITLALAIAQSQPEQRDIIIKLIINLIKN